MQGILPSKPRNSPTGQTAQKLKLKGPLGVADDEHRLKPKSPLKEVNVHGDMTGIQIQI